MINVSDEFKLLMDERTDFKTRATIEFVSGDVYELGYDDFVVSGNSFTDGANSTSLPLGEAVGRSINLEIINDSDEYADIDFFGAKIALYLDYELSETVESIDIGSFTVLDPETYGETIIISAVDDMYKADKPYASSLSYPTTLAALFREACEKCNISYLSSEFNNSDFEVETALTSDYTFRQFFGFAAMIAGGNARISRSGYMEILSYSFPDIISDIDGGSFEPWNNGYVADGGDFTFSESSTIDGGSFRPWRESVDISNMNNAHLLYNWRIDSLKMDTNDTVITGIQTTVISTGESGEETEETIITGTDGYVINIENPLIKGQEKEAIDLIGELLIGKSFRKFEGEHTGYPIAEFMDTVISLDTKGRLYSSIITDVTFNFFGYTTIANKAESILRNSRVYSGPETKAIIEAKKLVEKEKSDRQVAVNQLALKLSQSSGLYPTVQEQTDGSLIWLLHDKPTLAESEVVIKVTAQAVGFSTDGGKTYPFGITVDGETIMQIIQTEGLNADWIKTGALTVRDSDGNTLLEVNVTSNTVTIGGWTVSFDGLKAMTEDGHMVELDSANGVLRLGSMTLSSGPMNAAGTYGDATIQSSQPIWVEVGGKTAARFSDYAVQFYQEIILPEGDLTDYIVEFSSSGSWMYRRYASGLIDCWGDIEVTFPEATLFSEGIYRSIVQIDMSEFMTDIIEGSCPIQLSGKIPQVCRNGSNSALAELIILSPQVFDSFTAVVPVKISGLTSVG